MSKLSKRRRTEESIIALVDKAVLPDVLTDAFAQELMDIEESGSEDSDSDTSRSSSNDASSSDDNDHEDDDSEVNTLSTTPEPEIMAPPNRGRKRGRPTKKASDSESQTPPTDKKITFVLEILSNADLALPSTKRFPKQTSMQHSTNEPWDRIKAQILVRISRAIEPKHLDFANYSITATATRLLPKPGLPLSNEEEYKILLERVTSWKTTTPTLNLHIIETVGNASDKENVDPKDGEKKKKKKKSDEPVVLPGNEVKLQYMQLLRDTWPCPKSTSTCLGTFCYIKPDTKEHLVLSHERLDCWASAIQQGPETATIKLPPNHKLFPLDGKASTPNLLERRLERRSAESASKAPVINVSFPPELLGARGLPAPQPDPSNPTSILPSSHLPGPGLDIPTFCTTYKLDPEINAKLTKNAFRDARHLRFTSVKDLKEMGFVFGEIAAIQDAIEAWSLPKAD